MTANEFNELGKDLKETLILRYSPIALKVLHEGDPIPEGTVRPLADEGHHLAMCQAYAAVRRDRKAYTMLKDDHWCVWPLVSYGICPWYEGWDEKFGDKFFMDDPQKSITYFKNEYPRLKDTGVVGFSIAPLESCTFEPDIITVYCRPGQIRSLQMAAKFHSGKMIETKLDPVDSCVHSSIPCLNGQPFNITFPDPGEYERALADEDEVMFTMRSEQLPDVMDALHILSAAHFGYSELSKSMWLDFPRPPLYNDMYAGWGMEISEEWSK